MSLPSAGFHKSRGRRSATVSSSSRPSLNSVLAGPVSNSSSAVPSSTHPIEQYGSFRGRADPVAIPIAASAAASTPLSQKEPTRSFFISSFRGQPAPIDSAENVRHVREDTAELASYALSDQNGSIRSNSPSRRRSSITQTHLESYFNVPEDDFTAPINADISRPGIIQEVSEPVSPENGPSFSRSPGTSVLTNLLRHSPPKQSHPSEQEEEWEDESEDQGRGEETMTVSDNGQQEGQLHLQVTSNGVRLDHNERTPLLSKGSRESHHPDYIRGENDLEDQRLIRSPSWPKLRSIYTWPRNKAYSLVRTVANPKTWDARNIWHNTVVVPVGYVPAVILGCLLNILDALSYGMILFPLGQPIFESLGPAGISMFYVSCIVSQLVYSCGGSIFKGGIGSEMIEVVPFFHKMAFTIIARVGEDKPDVVIATTITAYAISSVLTGLVFFLMGVCRFGYIVGFIPRHILIGCIGGVGWFLVATGFEVTARLDGSLEYNVPTLRKMFELDTLFLWLIPFILAIILYTSSKKVTSKYYLPTFILAIPAIFYFFIFAIDELTIPDLVSKGWIFNGPSAHEPWWYFYTLYKFQLVNWEALAETIPAMFALTFFGVLHVPINIPALAFNIGEDHMNLDRELVAHGISNVLSGFAGSIQNYLVYTNSVLFIKSGGNSRVAGVFLAVATGGILLIGPVIIGYIPVMMVGVLIFVLGFELFFEAIWEPRKKLKLLEYLTVLAIVFIMGIYDFVIGIFIGIGLAFVSLVVQTSRISAVRASYSGEIAGSTVRRNPIQYRYLREAGKQIHVTKLAGYLFFGTIVSVEERIRSLIDDEAFSNRPIRYLIFDLWHVSGIDYSAAEAFNRINRIFSGKGVTIVMSGVDPNSAIGLSLRNVGLGEDGNEVALFPDLNAALESCENELLKAFYASRDARTARHASVPSQTLEVPRQKSPVAYSIDTQFSSPRRSQLHRVATATLIETEGPSQPRWQNFKEPLRLILQTFQGLTSKNEDFWFRAVPYFKKKEYLSGTILYERGSPAKGFYLLEEGILRADYDLPQGRYFESIVAGTTCGELPFFSETERTATVQAERDCVTWLLDKDNWEEIQENEPEVAQELLRISLKLTSERMSAITSYVLTTAG